MGSQFVVGLTKKCEFSCNSIIYFVTSILIKYAKLYKILTQEPNLLDQQFLKKFVSFLLIFWDQLFPDSGHSITLSSLNWELQVVAVCPLSASPSF